MANLVSIENYLKKLGLRYKVIDLGKDLPAGKAGVFTVAGVQKSGVNEGEIVKTLIVRAPNISYFSSSSAFLHSKGEYTGQANDNFVALVVRGKDRVDFKKVRKLFGPSTSLRAKCELAKAEEVKRVAKVPVGAVCPILLDVPIYVDENVLKLEHVHMGSGDLTKGLEMDLKDLLKAVGDYQVEVLV